MNLTDRFGRPITYLRISVTDRCNLRCVYCLPENGIEWQSRENQLSAEEIARVVETAASVGVKCVRLTGGEPLVRPDIVEIVARLASTPGIEEVSLTTNATLLERLAQPLADAGLKRVNISLDTLIVFTALPRIPPHGADWRMSNRNKFSQTQRTRRSRSKNPKNCVGSLWTLCA